MGAVVYVFLGGGLGSITRYLFNKGMQNWLPPFPFATFSANVVSCVILGALTALTMRGQLSQETRFLLMTGFCGGFSTFSTFSTETFLLFQNNQYGIAFANIFLNVIVCLAAVFLGMKLVQGYS